MEIVKDPDNLPEQRLIRMVDACQRPLLTLCCMLLRDASLAEDAVQETFLRAYRSLSGYQVVFALRDGEMWSAPTIQDVNDSSNG